MTMSFLKQQLAEPFALSAAQLEFFRLNGFVKIKNVLSPQLLEYLNALITGEVLRLNTQHLPLEERDTYGKAFLQIMNIWTQSPAVRDLVFSPRLARLAADLLGVDGVRLYHDQALFKEPGGGHTPWHADQYYWPLATPQTLTVWIPLQTTPLSMGPLEFSAGSHQITSGRRFEISDESESRLASMLDEAAQPHVVEPFEAGEVSFHAGWLYHRAGPNHTDTMRKVMTMIYMDKNMILKEPEHQHQIDDWQAWCPGATVGQRIDTPLNPVLYEKEGQ